MSVFLKSGKFSGKKFFVTEKAKISLENELANVLSQADEAGQEQALTMIKHHERAVSSEDVAISALIILFLKRARDIIKSILARITDLISSALENEESPEDALEALFDSLPEVIAVTEVHDAFESAVMTTLKRNGVEQVVWITSPGACPLCMDNEEQGPIDIGDAFESGHENPPAHPNCRCLVMIPER